MLSQIINNSNTILKNDVISVSHDKTDNKKIETVVIDYIDFFKKNIKLNKLKICDLKLILKKNKLRLSGRKPELILRILDFFNKKVEELNKKITKIQKIFRGNIVRFSNKLRGETYDKCTNDSDFYTMEKLKDISFKRYFSFKDKKGFIYGCDIFSLYILLQNANLNRKINIINLKNPYTREEINNEVIIRMLMLYNIIKIIYPNINTENNNENTESMEIRENIINPRLVRITNVRKKSLNERIRELFIEIDILGNYTQSSWFLNLNKKDYHNLYKVMSQLWNYAARIPQNIKQKICVYNNPFVNNHMPLLYQNLSIEELQNNCLMVMENIIYTGIDEEYKKIGTLHVLSALTVVSIEARNNLMFLYESLDF